MDKTRVDELLKREMVILKGGKHKTCECTSGAYQGSDGECGCVSGAGQKIRTPESEDVCICSSGANYTEKKKLKEKKRKK